MKKLFIALSISFLTGGCGTDVLGFPANNADLNLAHKAYYYYGLSESKDRQIIKDITGVDPVRTQWCAAFVNAVLLENDIPTSASVSDHPLMARSFLTWGDPVSEPKQGDIVVFERGNSGWKGHVGFYVGKTVVNGVEMIHVLGGNQGNEVGIDLYPTRKLLAIRRAPNP